MDRAFSTEPARQAAMFGHYLSGQTVPLRAIPAASERDLGGQAVVRSGLALAPKAPHPDDVS